MSDSAPVQDGGPVFQANRPMDGGGVRLLRHPPLGPEAAAIMRRLSDYFSVPWIDAATASPLASAGKMAGQHIPYSTNRSNIGI